MIYVHPVLGALSIALLIWVGLQGLRARHSKPYAGPARQRHARWVPWIFGAIVASLLTGMASALWLRDDLAVAASWHFWLGLITVGALGLNASLWWLENGEQAAFMHRWLGLVVLFLAFIQGSLGLGLLP